MKKWFLLIISGIFLILSYPPFNLKFLPFFALLPLFFFLNFQNISLKKSFFAGLITGFVFFGGTLLWFFQVLPLDWLGIENNFLGFFLLLFPWLLLILGLASFIGLFSLSYYFLKRKNFWDVLLIPALWVIFEYLRAWFFGVLYFGEESLLGPHWTFSNLAYAVAQNPNFRWLASIGGIYLVSFLIVLINVLIFFLLKNLIVKKRKIRFWCFAAVLIIISFLAASYFLFLPTSKNEENQTLKIAVLQSKIPSFFHPAKETIEEKIQIQNQLFEKALEFYPESDIIVFPEGANFLGEGNVKKLPSDFSLEKEILIIDANFIKTLKGKQSIAVFYTPQKGPLGYYQKILLSPVGEYLPYIFKLPAQIINEKWVERFEETRKYIKGKEITIFSSVDDWQIGTLFCSETLSPNLHRKLTEKGAEVLFNLGNLSFSHGSKNLNSQTQAMLQFRAAENGKYLVRATNYGTSYVINEKGEIVKKTSNLDNQVLLGGIKHLSQKTLYTKFGDWILVLAGFIILTFLLIPGKLKNRKGGI